MLGFEPKSFARISALWGGPVAIASVYFASASVGLAISRSSDGIAALWPANAILLSALLLFHPRLHWRLVTCCFVASLLSNLASGSALSLAVVFSIANSLAAVLAAGLIGRMGSGADAFQSIKGSGTFFLAVAIAASTGAAIGATAIVVSGGTFVSAWLSWASSDVLGMLLVSSVILTSYRQIMSRSGSRLTLGATSIGWPLILVAAVSAAVFSQSRLPLLFVPLAALVIATYRLGLIGAVVGTAIVAVVGTAFMSVGRGPISLFLSGPDAYRIEFFQFYLAVLFGTCLPLATLLSERARLALERAESDRRHRRILDRSREVIFETDLAGHWTYLNPAWRELTGMDQATSLGASFLSMIATEDRATALDRLAALYRNDVDEVQQEVQFVHSAGDIRWASVRSRLLLDEHGVTIGTYGNIHDTTERKAAEDARAESEHLYRLLADNSNDLIVRLSLQGVRRYVSPASINLLGYTPKEMLGEAAAGAIHPDDRTTAIATCNSLLDGADNPMCVYRQLHRNGSYVWLEASYRLIRDDTGAPAELIATVRDVSRREKAELDRLTATNQLSEANRLLLMAEEMSRVGHWRVDLASGSVFWSDMVCAIHGQSAGHVPSLEDAIAFYHPDDRNAVQASVDDAIEKGKNFGFNARLVWQDGTVRHVVSSGRVEKGPDGSAVGLFGVVQDVTEAHDADVALRAASRDLCDSNRLLTMAETIGQLGHWRIDYQTETMLWSDEVYAIYGLSPDIAPTAEHAFAVYHPDDVDDVRRAVLEARRDQAGYTSQARIIRGDGSIAHIVTRAEIEFDSLGNATAMFGIVQDVSERVEAQAGLQESEERFRLLTEQASDVISLHDITGRCLFMSPSVRTILGYEPSDMLGRDFRSMVFVEDAALIAQLGTRLASHARGDVATERFRLQRKDGSLVWIEAAARITEYRRQPSIVVVSRDVSDQVRVEEELQAARVAAEEAATAKSSFLANMSHEIRTPMNGVVGFTELLLAADLSDEQRRRAEMIADSGRAMMRLLNDILDLSKVEAGQMTVSNEPFDLVHALTACMKLVSPALEKKGLEVHCDFANDLPKSVCGDGLRLRQIVLNLLGNAAKFTQTGSVTLRAAHDTSSGNVVIAVQDTGIGISPDRQKAVFEQFVQADGSIASKFGGTGLGLAISARLAALMDGTLWLESEPGSGTTFYLSLPLLPASAPLRSLEPPMPIKDESDRPHKGTARILVAEDHDVNRLLMAEMLGKIGFAFDLAGNGEEATAMVAAARTSGNGYAAVLMDMQMPEVDGIEATRRIRASGVAADELPIIALTANAYADDIAACLDAGMQAHLAKPVSLRDLRSALCRWAGAVASAKPVITRRGSGPTVEERYRIRRTETLEAIGKMIRTGRFEAAELADVADRLHKLAGTAGMFGEGPLGDQARLLETGLNDWSPVEWSERVAQAYESIMRVAAG